MTKKIAIIGTFGVGKTTLLKELAKLPEFKDYHMVKETAREYLETNKLDINEVNANPEQLYQFQKQCLKQQWQEEQHHKFLSDRSVYDSLAYSELGLSDDKMADLLAEIDVSNYKYDTILYIPIEYPMSQADIADNRSPDEDYRARVDVEIFAQAMAHFPVTSIYTITGSVEERVKQVLEVLKLNTSQPKFLPSDYLNLESRMKNIWFNEGQYSYNHRSGDALKAILRDLLNILDSQSERINELEDRTNRKSKNVKLTNLN